MLIILKGPSCRFSIILEMLLFHSRFYVNRPWFMNISSDIVHFLVFIVIDIDTKLPILHFN